MCSGCHNSRCGYAQGAGSLPDEHLAFAGPEGILIDAVVDLLDEDDLLFIDDHLLDLVSDKLKWRWVAHVPGTPDEYEVAVAVILNSVNRPVCASTLI